MNVLSSLAVLGLLILIHEAGHFLAATFQGIKVKGFSIGFGPALIKKDLKGITFAIRALPLGGYVSFPEESAENLISLDDPDLLQNRPIPQRALVISAGVLANLLLAWVVLVGQAAFMGLPNQPDPGVLVVSVQSDQAAAAAGLVAGDRILSVEGKELGRGSDAVQMLVKEIKESPEITLELQRSRGSEESRLRITPTKNQGKGKIGAQLQPNVTGTMRAANGIGEIISHSDTQFLDLLFRTVQGYKGLLTDFNSTAQQLSGPVKIVEIGAQLSEQGSSGLVLFAALISINLAVLNALPLPLLDGGQLVLLIAEAIRGKPVPENLQMAFTQSGFLLLVGLSVVLIIRDTSQLSMVQQLMGH